MENSPVTKVEGTATVDASQTDIWNVVKQFGNIADYHPLVKQSHATNQVEGIGAMRYCRLIPAGVMEEEITEWEEGTSITAKVIAGKMLPPCHFMIGRLVITPNGRTTQVKFTFTYQMKFGVFGQVLNQFFIKPQFKSAPVKYVNGLKAYVEQSKAASFR